MIRPGWTPGPSHVDALDVGGGLPGRAVGPVVAVARGDRGGVEDRLLEPRDGGAQERPRVGTDHAVGRRRAAHGGRRAARGRRASSAGRRAGTRVAVRGDLAQPRADDQQGVGGPRGARGRPRGCRSRPCPRYSGWSLGMTSPRRQAAITGTCSSSAKRTRSFEQRARSTPAPARMTGRSAAARRWSTARTSATAGTSGCERTTGARVPSGSGHVEEVLGQREQGAGPGGPRPSPDGRLERGRGRRRVVDLARPLREAADRPDLVDLLERLAAADRGRPGRRGRTSASSRRSRCGCRWRGSRPRRRACRGRRPAGR